MTAIFWLVLLASAFAFSVGLLLGHLWSQP